MTDALFPDPKVDALVEALQHVPGWPSDPIADEEFARRTIARYPSLPLIEMVDEFEVWLLDNPVRAKQVKNWRSTFNTRLKNGVRYATGRREAGRAGPHGANSAGRRASSRAGTAGEHAPTGRLDGW